MTADIMVKVISLTHKIHDPYYQSKLAWTDLKFERKNVIH